MSADMRPLHIGIVGATGQVGAAMRSILADADRLSTQRQG